MKKTILSLIAFLIVTVSYAQDFKGHVSAAYGVINTKIRLQYEHPINDRATFGMNVNYYTDKELWTGPMLEPFFRLYKGNDNAEGLFSQVKFIYGNLSTMDYEKFNGALANKRTSTYGVSVSGGYKLLMFDYVTFEGIIGARLLTAPTLEFKEGVNANDYEEDRLGQVAVWYLTTGLPVDLQLKIGYQF